MHSQVISSYSGFLRVSMTSAAGSAKRTRNSLDDPCKWQLQARMDAGDVTAVEAVFKHLYTSSLSGDLTGHQLLRIMRVSFLSGSSPIFCSRNNVRAAPLLIHSLPCCSSEGNISVWKYMTTLVHVEFVSSTLTTWQSHIHAQLSRIQQKLRGVIPDWIVVSQSENTSNYLRLLVTVPQQKQRACTNHVNGNLMC